MTATVTMPGACPYCGAILGSDDSPLDGYVLEGRELHAEWPGCCQAGRELVEAWGVEEVFGMTWAEALALEVGIDGVREVYLEDGLCRFRLEVYAPGTGVRGWQKDIFQEIRAHHRHHLPPTGWKFGVACYSGAARVGVAVVGRPVSRMLDAKETVLEVTRLCTFGDRRLRRNAASKLLAACARGARELGATLIVTYTLAREDGASLRAAGWTAAATTRGGSWSRSSRPREDKAPTEQKTRWELELAA